MKTIKETVAAMEHAERQRNLFFLRNIMRRARHGHSFDYDGRCVCGMTWREYTATDIDKLRMCRGKKES